MLNLKKSRIYLQLFGIIYITLSFVSPAYSLTQQTVWLNTKNSTAVTIGNRQNLENIGNGFGESKGSCVQNLVTKLVNQIDKRAKVPNILNLYQSFSLPFAPNAISFPQEYNGSKETAALYDVLIERNALVQVPQGELTSILIVGVFFAYSNNLFYCDFPSVREVLEYPEKTQGFKGLIELRIKGSSKSDQVKAIFVSPGNLSISEVALRY